MLRDIANIAIVGAVGWVAWGELHARGYLTMPPPDLRTAAGKVTSRIAPRRKASGDVDKISGKTARAVAYARQAGVPVGDIALVAGFIAHESGSNPMAHNTNGEDSRGLMQVQLSTANGLHEQGYIQHLAKDQLGTLLFDPVHGVEVGHAFIKYLRARIPDAYDDDALERLEWTIRAYNGGESWHTKGDRVARMTEIYFEKVMGEVMGARTFIDQEAL